MSKSIAAKAEKYFKEGRVSEISAEGVTVTFLVKGSSDYTVTGTFSNVWGCDCPARVSSCAHIQAAKLFCLHNAGDDTKLGRLREPSFNFSKGE